jgi:hypothetical protein
MRCFPGLTNSRNRRATRNGRRRALLRSYLGGSGLRPRRTGSNRWHEQNDAARKRSPAKFQDFLAHEGRSDLSQEELQKLFAQFLEWERRAKN